MGTRECFECGEICYGCNDNRSVEGHLCPSCREQAQVALYEYRRCPLGIETATGHFDPAGEDGGGADDGPVCAGCGSRLGEHREPPPWRTGFVFIDNKQQPYLVSRWTDDWPWLFHWHPEGHWTSLRKLTHTEVRTFRHLAIKPNLQEHYSKKHEGWMNLG